MEERCGQVGIEFKFPPRDRIVTFVFSYFTRTMAVIILQFKPRPFLFACFLLDWILCVVSQASLNKV